MKSAETNLGLDCLTLWAKLRTANVLRFRYTLISKKLSGADLTSYVIKHTGGTFLLILSYLERRMTQALRLNDCFLLPMYVYTHFIHPHASFISIILYRI